MEEYNFDVIKISYCKKHKIHWIWNCPECMAETADQDLLRKIRDKWAYESACGHPVMSLRLDDWIALCKKKGLGNEDWWELKQEG